MEEVEETVTHVNSSTPDTIVTKKVVHPVVQTEHPQKAYNKKKTIFRAYQVIWYLLGVIEVLLAFRFVLKAIGASPYSGFVSFIYIVSAPFAGPFQGVVGSYVSSGAVVEWSTVIAAIVYFVVAYGLVYLIQLIKPVGQEEVEETVDNP